MNACNDVPLEDDNLFSNNSMIFQCDGTIDGSLIIFDQKRKIKRIERRYRKFSENREINLTFALVLLYIFLDCCYNVFA